MTPRRGECKSTSGRVPLQFRFPIEKKILALFSTVSHHKPEKPRKFRFQKKILGLYSKCSHNKPKKNTEIPFSKRRYWHYFPDKPNISRISRFQMRFPITSQKKTTEILFSNRRYWHYFPEVPSQAKKTRKFRFQIEEALFSRGSHHKHRKNTKIPL